MVAPFRFALLHPRLLLCVQANRAPLQNASRPRYGTFASSPHSFPQFFQRMLPVHWNQRTLASRHLVTRGPGTNSKHFQCRAASTSRLLLCLLACILPFTLPAEVAARLLGAAVCIAPSPAAAAPVCFAPAAARSARADAKGVLRPLPAAIPCQVLLSQLRPTILPHRQHDLAACAKRAPGGVDGLRGTARQAQGR